MKHLGFRKIFIGFLCLSISISIHFYKTATPSNTKRPITLIDCIPMQIRSVLAGVLWSKADEYMHLGPSLREKATYTAGSFAGNTELISLLSLAIELAPQHIQTYEVLAQNLSKYLGLFNDGLRVLQLGIINNKHRTCVNELYAEAAFQYLFSIKETKKTLIASLKYINKAIKLFPKASTYSPRQKIYSLPSYYMVQARVKEKLEKYNHAINHSNSSKKKVVSNDLSKQKKALYKQTNQHEYHHHHITKQIQISLKDRFINSFILLGISFGYYSYSLKK